MLFFFENRVNKFYPLVIEENSIIRSENIICGDCNIGDNFQTGHRVTIIEKSPQIGKNVRVGILSDIQGHCTIGDYVNIHSNVHIGHKSDIKNYVWIFPYVVLINDPNPPSENLLGVTIEEFSSVAARSVILPEKHIGKDALIGAGSVVTKDVQDETVVVGNPAKVVCNIRDIKDKVTGDDMYPWRFLYYIRVS